MGNVKAAILLTFGYLLIYAAIHDGGAYATSPWKALSA